MIKPQSPTELIWIKRLWKTVKSRIQTSLLGKVILNSTKMFVTFKTVMSFTQEFIHPTFPAVRELFNPWAAGLNVA